MTAKATYICVVQNELGFRVVVEWLDQVVVDDELLKLFVCVLLIGPVLSTLHTLPLHRPVEEKQGMNNNENVISLRLAATPTPSFQVLQSSGCAGDITLLCWYSHNTQLLPIHCEVSSPDLCQGSMYVCLLHSSNCSHFQVHFEECLSVLVSVWQLLTKERERKRERGGGREGVREGGGRERERQRERERERGTETETERQRDRDREDWEWSASVVCPYILCVSLFVCKSVGERQRVLVCCLLRVSATC